MMRIGLFAILVALPLVGCRSGRAGAPHLVYVSQAASGDLAVIDPVARAVRKRITVGMLPHNLLLSPEGSRLYVVLVGSQALAEIDIESATLRRTFLTAPVPERRPDGSVIHEHRDRNAASKASCFACHYDGPGAAKPKYVGDRPFGLASSADGARLFVSHLRSGDVSVIDRASGRIVQTVHLPPAGEAKEAAEVARLGSELFVALRPPQPASTSGVIRRLDAQTLESLGETQTGSDPVTVQSLEARGRVLVSNFETNTVSELDSGRLTAKYTVAPGPLGLVPLRDGRRVLVLNYYSNSTSILDLRTGRADTVKLELDGHAYANPTHAALSPDGRTAYIVSSGTDAHLLTFDLERRRVVAALPIDGLSYDVAVVNGKALLN